MNPADLVLRAAQLFPGFTPQEIRFDMGSPVARDAEDRRVWQPTMHVELYATHSHGNTGAIPSAGE